MKYGQFYLLLNVNEFRLQMSVASSASKAKEAKQVEGSQTVTENVSEDNSPPPTLKLRLQKGDTRNQKKVVWSSETVDNEHLGRKKSKCCCVYVKKKTFGQSDSEESDDDCDHCSGHTPSDPKAKN